MDYLKFTIWIFVSITVDKSLAIFTEYVELCSNRQEIRLTGHDSRASAIVLLDPTLGMPSERCTLQVSAPPGFVINMGIIENRLEIHRALVIDHNERYVQCPLNVYLPAEDNHTDPIYRANLCSLDSTPQPPLFPPDRLLLTWTPSSTLTSDHIRGRQILLTAVGQSPAICNASTIGPVASVLGDYHACMTVGRQPLLCISRYLVCNEQENCPRGSTYSDEDDAMCRKITPDQNSWEELARKLMQQWNLPIDGFSEKWVQSGGGKLRVGEEDEVGATTETTVGKFVSIWKKIEATTRRPNTSDQPSNSTSSETSNSSDPLSISAVLNQYGPWGYLMLGMLLCGTVLLLCGIWECCFRTPKPRARSPQHHVGSAGGTSSANTTVLIISAEETAQHPPNYEDLDQPPLYTALFPTSAAEEPGTVGDDANKTRVIESPVEESSEIVMRRLSGGSSVRTLGEDEDEERLREVTSGSDMTSASDNVTS